MNITPIRIVNIGNDPNDPKDVLRSDETALVRQQKRAFNTDTPRVERWWIRPEDEMLIGTVYGLALASNPLSTHRSKENYSIKERWAIYRGQKIALGIPEHMWLEEYDGEHLHDRK